MRSTPDWWADARTTVLHVRSTRGSGSAFVWSASPTSSLLITNHHVVAGRADVLLSGDDGKSMRANVVASDASLDLALLEVDVTLPAVRLGDSRVLRPGEVVFALGHPWGRPWVLTHGVVSAVGMVNVGRDAREFVRSDVRLAPGNSGGPLLNAAGEVIGVNSMVWGGTLGVAVPTHVVTEWLGATRVEGRSGKLGVDAARAMLDGRPVVILTFVEPGEAAHAAGLRQGDVILAANGERTSTPDGLRAILSASDAVELDVWRSGESRRVTVPLASVGVA